jgi:hypothetical protein
LRRSRPNARPQLLLPRTNGAMRTAFQVSNALRLQGRFRWWGRVPGNTVSPVLRRRIVERGLPGGVPGRPADMYERAPLRMYVSGRLLGLWRRLDRYPVASAPQRNEPRAGPRGSFRFVRRAPPPIPSPVDLLRSSSRSRTRRRRVVQNGRSPGAPCLTLPAIPS